MKERMRTPALLAAWTACAALLLAFSAQAGEGARQGLSACGSVIIPSLFPFMALASFAAATPVSRVLRRLAALPARLIWGLPGEAAPALVMSLIGGYPAGAKVLAAMVDTGELSPEAASRALPCCLHAGPAFMAGVAGGALLGSVRSGLWLYLCQIAAGAITGRILRRLLGNRARQASPASRTERTRESAPAPASPGGRRSGAFAPASGRTSGFASAVPKSLRQAPAPEQGLAAAFVASVADGASGILAICAFVVLFSALLGVLEGAGVLSAGGALVSRLSGGRLTREGGVLLLRGLTEICSGCSAARGAPVSQLRLFLPFLLSFSSLSVICQVAAVTAGRGIRLGPFAFSRLLHGFLTAALSLPVLRGAGAEAVLAPSVRPVPVCDGFTLAGTLCLLAMCAILFAALPAPKTKIVTKSFERNR